MLYCFIFAVLQLEPLYTLARACSRPQLKTSWSHKDTFFTCYWSRNIFITLSGVSGQSESVERRAQGERGHVEPDGDSGMTL